MMLMVNPDKRRQRHGRGLCRLHGPPQPSSPIQSPAHFRAFRKTQRLGGARAFSYADPSGQYTATLTSNDHIEFTKSRLATAVGGKVALDPVWSLIAAQALAQRRVVAR